MARPGGGSGGRPKRARRRRTAWGSVTAPRIRRAPPQCGQTRISIANTRRRSVAHDSRPGPVPEAVRGEAGKPGRRRRHQPRSSRPPGRSEPAAARARCATTRRRPCRCARCLARWTRCSRWTVLGCWPAPTSCVSSPPATGFDIGPFCAETRRLPHWVPPRHTGDFVPLAAIGDGAPGGNRTPDPRLRRRRP